MKIENIINIESYNDGAAEYKISSLETEFGHPLPKDYVELLKEADGFVLKNGVLIYSSEDVHERNETFEVNEYAPGYIAIGDDSGGVSIVMNIATQRIFVVDQGSMDPDDMEEIAVSLPEWINSSCSVAI